MRFDGAQLSVEVLTPRVRVVRVAGVLDPAAVARLAAVSAAQLGRFVGHVVIDLGEVSHFDTDDLAVLVAARDLARRAAVDVHVAGLAARASMLPVGIVSALKSFSTFPTVEQAERELATPSRSRLSMDGPRSSYGWPCPAPASDEGWNARSGPVRHA